MKSEIDINDVRRLRKIVVQLQDIGWSKVKSIDKEFKNLRLTYRDEATEKVHELTMILPDNYPDEPPYNMNCQELPPSALANLFTSNRNGADRNSKPKQYKLIDIYSSFVDNIDKYRPLRRMFRDIDQNTWVLDPADEPARKSLEYTYRRVAISKGVSLQIDLKPDSTPDEIPGLKFLGSDDKVRPLREVLSRNLENYDPDYTLVQNLERILELEFPLQQSSMEEQEDLNLECAICYSYRLGEQFPTETCDDPAGCGKSFHEACLFEWLRSLPEQCSKMSFRSIFGNCPYCDKQISCKISN